MSVSTADFYQIPSTSFNNITPSFAATCVGAPIAIAQRTFQIFEKQIYGYLRETTKVVKDSLKVTAGYYPESAAKISKVVPMLGYTSLVDLMFTLRDFPTTFDKAYRDFQRRDVDAEGSAISSIGTLMTAVGATENFTSFHKSLNELGAVPRVDFFGKIGLPLSMSLLTYVSAKGFYDLFQNIQELRQMPNENDSVDHVKNYIKSILNDKREINITRRRTDEKVIKIMEKIKIDIDSDFYCRKDIANMRTLLKRKIAVGTMATLGNAALAAAILPVFGLNSLTISAVSLGRSAIMFGKVIYNRNFFHANLRA